MSQTATSPNGYPLHLDRNKSIIWARYLIDSPDWLIFASRVSRLTPEVTPLTGPIKLLSLSLLTPSGKVIFESMLKPQEMIPATLISEHGLDYAVVFNAQPFSEILQKLRQLIGTKQILAWDLDAQQGLLDQLCAQFAQPILPLAGYSLRPEYARYVGESDGQTGAYKTQTLTSTGVGATAECRAMLNTLTTMASTSQIRDTAPTGHQGWTAELYKPKINPKEKIKDFLGL
jgi:DNA polymerase III epsilon subunit-like protein